MLQSKCYTLNRKHFSRFVGVGRDKMRAFYIENEVTTTVLNKTGMILCESCKKPVTLTN